MINDKATLRKFHKLQPNLSIDELLDLLDGIVEKQEYNQNYKDIICNPSTLTEQDSKKWDDRIVFNKPKSFFGDAETYVRYNKPKFGDAKTCVE